MDKLQINIPGVLAELSRAFYAYEAALMANEVESLIHMFWQNSQAVRYGRAENLYGWEAIVNFRKHRSPPAPRTLFNTVMTSFGELYANVSTEFRSGDKLGRQSQSWVRTEQGWRIAAAHVSFLT